MAKLQGMKRNVVHIDLDALFNEVSTIKKGSLLRGTNSVLVLVNEENYLSVLMGLVINRVANTYFYVGDEEFKEIVSNLEVKTVISLQVAPLDDDVLIGGDKQEVAALTELITSNQNLDISSVQLENLSNVNLISIIVSPDFCDLYSRDCISFLKSLSSYITNEDIENILFYERFTPNISQLEEVFYNDRQKKYSAENIRAREIATKTYVRK